MLKRAVLSILVGLMAALPPVLFNTGYAAAVDPNVFSDTLVRSVDQPTALAFTPDGRMLITTKPGRLRIFEPGTPGTTRALDISARTCSNRERGLLGVAVDPNFQSNHFVYLYYTYKKYGVCPDHEPANPRNPVSRVSRFVMSGDTIDPTSEMVLINNIPSPNGNHNAGDLKFGNDGYLYISIGDGGCDYAEPLQCQYNNDASRDRHVLLGKILRITRNGGIPPDNPYTNPDNSARCKFTGHTDPGKNCQETFTRGFRNPFRMAFDPDATGTRFWINDVGGAAWEEIDAGKKGADYAWNLCEGRHDNPYRAGSVDCTKPPYTGPIHEYNHTTGCESITGGTFVPNNSNWPASYNDSYLFGDFVCNKVFKLTPKNGGGFNSTLFTSVPGPGPIAMGFGPNGSGQALFYTTFDAGGQVRRITYTG